MIGIRSVRGHSMEPSLKEGSRVVVLAYVFSKPKVGDIIVFRNGGREFVKRIAAVAKSGEFAVKGDNENDSLKVPPVWRSQIIGRVIFSY